MNIEANFVFYIPSKKWFHKYFMTAKYFQKIFPAYKINMLISESLESTERRKIGKRKKSSIIPPS